jgi:hypothetical protein
MLAARAFSLQGMQERHGSRSLSVKKSHAVCISTLFSSSENALDPALLYTIVSVY